VFVNIYKQNITQKFRKYKGVYTDFMLTLCGQNTNFCDVFTIYSHEKVGLRGCLKKLFFKIQNKRESGRRKKWSTIASAVSTFSPTFVCERLIFY